MIYFKKCFISYNFESVLKYKLEIPINGQFNEIYSSESEELVGFIKYKDVGNHISITSIEILSEFRRKGFAKAVITAIKSKYPEHTIEGQSMPYDDIKEFWQKQGAIFFNCERCLLSASCGGPEVLGVNCDTPKDYQFIIPADSNIQKHEIAITKTFFEELPVIVIGMEDTEETLDERSHMIDIALNINSKFFKDNIYVSLEGKKHIPELEPGHYIPDFFANNSKGFIDSLTKLDISGIVQIVGMHRELCLVQAAAIIKKNLPHIEPIILESDDFSISATFSVMHGDTLENRITEEGFCIRYI